MSNQPVYRRQPRSHAYSCRCPRCVQFLNRPSASSSGAFWGVVALMVLYGMPAAIWHQGTGMVVACAIWWPVLTAVTALIAYGSYRGKHPPPRKAPPSGPPVSSLPPSPPPSPAPRCCGAPLGTGHWGNCPNLRQKGTHTMSTPDGPEPVNEEFAAFRAEFLDHLLPEDMPEDQKQMWRDLR